MSQDVDHLKEAERLLKKGKGLIAASHDPHAAGSRIRARWRAHGNALLAEAAVHAALAAAQAKGVE